MFNTTDFLTATYNESLDTTRTPVPVGEYNGQIGMGEKDLAIEQGISAKEQKPWARLDALVTIPDPSGTIKAATGRDPVVVRHGIMLDLDINGKIDMSAGKNVKLGKLLEAAGWPVDDKKRLTPGWSFGFLKGKQVKLKISHDPNLQDPTAPPYERVDAVTKVS